jgi:hypothetical protein
MVDETDTHNNNNNNPKKKKKKKKLTQAGDSAMVLVIRRPLIATLTKLVENKNGDEDPPESHKPKYKYFTN